MPLRRLALYALLVALLCTPASTAAPEQSTTSFVTRSGAQLQLAGRPFRFGGANVESSASPATDRSIRAGRTTRAITRSTMRWPRPASWARGSSAARPWATPSAASSASNPPSGNDRTAASRVETGQWWALYYTGIRTLVNTAKDMAARAQVIRAHNYAIAGRRVPPHGIPPQPSINFRRLQAVLAGGSAGAKNYSVQRAPGAGGPWTTICWRCVADASNGYVAGDSAARNSWYRVTPYNLDGKLGRASVPKQAESP